MQPCSPIDQVFLSVTILNGQNTRQFPDSILDSAFLNQNKTFSNFLESKCNRDLPPSITVHCEFILLMVIHIFILLSFSCTFVLTLLFLVKLRFHSRPQTI